MEARAITPQDYFTIVEWWKAHNWPVMPSAMLPTTGFIVEDTCAGFIYKTDSSVAILEFMVSNPASDKNVRSDGLDLVITALVNAAKESGYSSIFTSVNHTKLADRYKKHGFLVGDENMTNLVRII